MALTSYFQGAKGNRIQDTFLRLSGYLPQLGHQNTTGNNLNNFDFFILFSLI